MCDFFSAVIRRDGKIFHLPTNSHSGIVAHYQLTENDQVADLRGKPRFYEFEWGGIGPVPAIGKILRGANPPKAVLDAANMLATNLAHALADPGWGLLDGGFFDAPEFADLRWKALTSEHLDHRIADRLAVTSLHTDGKPIKSLHPLITKLDGCINVRENASLTAPALTEVGGSIYVRENAKKVEIPAKFTSKK